MLVGTQSGVRCWGMLVGTEWGTLVGTQSGVRWWVLRVGYAGGTLVGTDPELALHEAAAEVPRPLASLQQRADARVLT